MKKQTLPGNGPSVGARGRGSVGGGEHSCADAPVRPCARASWTLALLLTLLLPLTAWAQERLAVVTESGTPMVAVEVLLEVGPINEPPERAGITHLAARALVEPLHAQLDEIGASVAVQSYKDAVGLTLLAAPDAWEEASRMLLVALFRDPVDNRATERVRRAIQAELEGRAANPTDALATEVDRAFWGPDHPWGRAAVGTPQTVRQIRVDEVDGFLREHFRPNRTFVAVVGPVSQEDATAHLTAFLGTGAPVRLPEQAGMPEDLVLRREYNSITTWITASYRFGRGADLEALRLLTHLATESLSFGPRRPSIYNARGEMFARPGEGEIRIQIVVPPGEAEEWATRMQEAVQRLAARPLPTEEFEPSLRSFRGRRLLALSSPEARAREFARQLLLTGRVAPLAEFDELTPARLRQAAGALESPIVLLLGPALRSE
jgi:predicted Zn-dependent peptidase